MIPGLRAVFGEAYPDPVRVVSLEYSLEEILQDVTNPKWRSTSVEFCGGTHVAKTGDIKDFVITEESGIAKGIRRVVAVTGEEANEVTRVANAFESRLERIEKMSLGKEKDAALKAYQFELLQADISVVRKAKLKDRLAVVRKTFDQETKALEAAAVKAVLDVVTQHFAENPNATVYVAEVQLEGSSKSLQSIITHLKSLGKAAYIFSVDSEAGKVAHMNYLPKEVITSDFNAKSWAGVVSEILGGKAGGKDDSAQGVGTNVPVLGSAIEAAETHFQQKTVGR
jgi:alanyl-tRNA synthetase